MSRNPKPTDIYLEMTERERNIYEPAQLFSQRRKKVEEFVECLRSPDQEKKALQIDGETVRSDDGTIRFSVKDEVVDFRTGADENKEWEELNEQFLNYHKSLSPYTLINSASVINYLSLKTGLGELKNAKVLDVGGGTGHTHCSFFRYPETIDYHLLDPNLRLMHDQFIRVYPMLSYVPMVHVLGYAEDLPFKEDYFDIVMSVSSIDHFKDYPQFIKDAKRVLKPGGQLLISSHLDVEKESEKKVSLMDKLFSNDFLEMLARYMYFRRHRVGSDDHTYHFTTSDPIKQTMLDEGFEIEASETYSRYFFIVGRKK